MQGPERERHRAAFERWHGSSPLHARAYEEAITSFREGGVLEKGELARARGLPRRRTGRVPLRYAFAGTAVAVAMLALLILASAQVAPPVQDGETLARYATASRETRAVRLADGSRMSLSPGTVAVVALSRGERRITLERGRGRFSVAREARPFRVAAGQAEVVALGTLFEVSLAAGTTRVSLIEGSVDVSYPVAAPGTAGRRVTRLAPGQQIVVGGNPPGRPRPAATPPDNATSAMLQFDDTPLAQAVAEANRRSRIKIRIADPAIGGLRITGAFRASDTHALAESLEAAFRLDVERLADGTILLRPRAPASAD